MKSLIGLVFVLSTTVGATAQMCSMTSVGKTPLTDLGTGTYMGMTGGLYPGGSNVRPAAHEAAGLAQAALIVPRDATGAVDYPFGKIVFLSLGMSNTTQEFSTFMPIAAADPNKASRVLLVDGAQGGQDAVDISDPSAAFWTNVDTRLATAGVTANQVQAVWLKEAIAGASGSFVAHANLLKGYLKTICQIALSRYPNLKQIFLSSRIYGGYATTMTNPEPYAYEGGFAVKWLIEDQIAGDPGLNYGAVTGPITAPWLSWGPYLWADGTTPRSDGLVWNCSDYVADGTHPGTTGRQKVAAMLNTFMTTDTATTPWYLASIGSIPAIVNGIGPGTPGTLGPPLIVTNGAPRLGRAEFAIGVQMARAQSPAILLVSLAPAQLVFGSATVWVDPNFLILPNAGFSTTLATNQIGNAFIPLPIPADPLLEGIDLFAQWFVYDTLGQGFPEVGGAALSGGLYLQVGY